MKKTFTLLLLLIATSLVSAQSFQEKKMQTTIEEVTVFLKAAHITRIGEREINTGNTLLKISGLSPYLDPKSLQVKGEGDFTILSVNHNFNYLDSLTRDVSLDSLKTIATDLDFNIVTNQSRLEVLTEKQSLLSSNKSLGGETAGVSIDQLSQAIALYERELSAIKADEIKTHIKLKKLKHRKRRIEQEIYHIKNQDELPTSEIEIRIEAKQKANAQFRISYLVTHAGWYPKYDVRVKM